MNIYLIGMPGSGKTTIGKKLSKKLNYNYIDIDNEIEKSFNMTIKEIINKFGIGTFRNLETNFLKGITNNNNIVSCGGGIVLNKLNKDLMSGLVIFIDVDLNILNKRLKNDNLRPLLKTTNIETLYKERIENYKYFANFTITNNKKIDEAIKHIIKRVGHYNEKDINN